MTWQLFLYMFYCFGAIIYLFSLEIKDIKYGKYASRV
jgi:hypothetical protein